MELTSQGYQLLGLILLSATVIALWLRLNRVEKKLTTVITGLVELVEESETATNELRAGLARLDERAATTSAPPALAQPTFDPAFPFSGPDSNDPWDLDRRHRVLKLARTGLTAPEIARRLSLPDGEVELMLRLSRSAVN